MPREAEKSRKAFVSVAAIGFVELQKPVAIIGGRSLGAEFGCECWWSGLEYTF